MPHHGDARAAAPGLRAPGNGGTGPPRPAPETAARARLLAFAGVALAAVYVRSEDGSELCLVESVGAESGQPYQLPGRVAVPVSGGSPGTGPSASPGPGRGTAFSCSSKARRCASFSPGR